MKWLSVPEMNGWYWHRFFVGDKPIHNTCYVRVSERAVYVHHLGEVQEQRLVKRKGVTYWGPLKIPVE
jgi:hypothetical protein